jgi:hypothetical protein
MDKLTKDAKNTKVDVKTSDTKIKVDKDSKDKDSDKNTAKISSDGVNGSSSLMDSLVANIQSSEKISITDSKIKSTKTTDTKVESDKQISAKIFLSNQEQQKDIISKQKIKEAKDTVKKEPNTTTTLKKTTEILELNASDIKIETKEVETKKDGKVDLKEQLKQQNTMLNKLFLNNTQDSKLATLNKELEVSGIKTATQTKEAQDATKKTNDDIKITVEQSVAQTFNTKIVESKQKMNSFMSDVAKQMSLNYKPPVTSFTIKLDPVNLGNIAITMKSTKADNKVSVSLNMSQTNTLDTFVDNKSMLQNALNKVFNEDKSFSLDFGMQQDNNQSSNQSHEQERDNQKSQKQQTNTINNITEDIQEEDKSYM